MPQEPIGVAELFQAVKLRWDDSDLGSTITGGVYALDDPPENTKRPFVVLPEPYEHPEHFTNKTQFDTIEFTLELVADNLEVAGPLVSSIKSALCFAQLSLTTRNNAYLLAVFPGPVRYHTEKNYLRCPIEFTAKIGQSRIALI